MKRNVIAILFVLALLGIVAVITHYVRSVGQLVRDSYVSDWTAEFVIAHLKTNDNQWPRSWEDLRDEHTAEERCPFPFDEFQSRVEFDWNADSAIVAAAQPPQMVVQLTSGRSVGYDVDPNETIHDYLSTQDFSDVGDTDDVDESSAAGSAIVIDLASSKVWGLGIHETQEKVVRSLGQPDIDATADRKYFYAKHSMVVTFVDGRVHAMEFWLSVDAAKKSLAYDSDPSAMIARLEQGFAPSNAKISGRVGGSLQLRPGLMEREIVGLLGEADKVERWQDGGTTLTYFGKAVGGDRERLHLDFSLKADELRTVFVTY